MVPLFGLFLALLRQLQRPTTQKDGQPLIFKRERVKGTKGYQRRRWRKMRMAAIDKYPPMEKMEDNGYFQKKRWKTIGTTNGEELQGSR